MYVYTLEIDRNICDINKTANVWENTPFSSYKKALAKINLIQDTYPKVFHMSYKSSISTSWYEEGGNRMAIVRSKVY